MGRKHYPKGTWMKLHSKTILVTWMDKRNMSVTRLARYAGCSRAMIGHLRTGYKTSCSPELANAIEDALDVARGSLFEQQTPTVSGSISHRQVGRKAS